MQTISTTPKKWLQALKYAAIATLALRLGLGVVMAAAWIVARPHLPLEIFSDDSPYDGLSVPLTPTADAVLGVWVRWDAVHHLNLARLGYLQSSEGDSVYFPLYPALTRIAATLLGGNYILAGLLVSTIACMAALAILYVLSEGDYGPLTARWTVVALAAYPTALFLIAPSSESLFLGLVLASFHLARTRRWWLAGATGFLAGLTRPNGIILAAPLLFLAWQEWRQERPSLMSRKSASMLVGTALPLAGGLAFLTWRSMNGFPPVSQILETHSGLVMANPLAGLTAAVVQWFRVHQLPTTLDVASALAFIILIGLMAAHPRWRRGEWLIFAGANLLLVLFKQSFVASSLQSMSRYVLVIFPAFVFLGDLLSRSSTRLRLLYVTFSGGLLIFLSVAYTLWMFVG